MTDQLDLFYAIPGDLPWRDDRESMTVPMLSLAQQKRVKPIEWTSSDGKLWCRVTANSHFGMASIYDFDVILWAISQVNQALERDLKTSPTLHFQPHDLLKSIGRGVGGDHYKRLKTALERLNSTTVQTSIRADKRMSEAMFSWLETWTHDTDEETGRSIGMTITLPSWLYRGIIEERAILAIPPEYFNIKSGLARWLYRLARRHAGKQPGGWRFLIRGLHGRSGSTQRFPQFTQSLRRIVDRDDLPEYHLEIITGQKGDLVLSIIRDLARGQVAQRRDLRRFPLPPLPPLPRRPVS